MNSSVQIEDCIFRDNMSVFTGGGILVEGCESVTIRNCLFVENSASMGGGVGCEGNENILIESSRFLNNTANAGSAVYVAVCSLVTIVNSTIENNKSVGEGAVASISSHVILRECEIKGNEADFGGGLSCMSGGATTVKECIFSGNSALTWGGAINCIQESLVVSNTVIYSNSAGKEGGAVNLLESLAFFDSCTVNNISIGNFTCRDRNSDGFFVTSSELTINNSQIYNNGKGVFVDTTNGLSLKKVDAVNNWWGKISGPYHPALNPDGEGDTVSNHVDFIPWIEISSTKEQKGKLPEKGILLSKLRNHIDGGVTFHFTTGKPCKIELSMYDLRGRLVRKIEEYIPFVGDFTLFWDGKTAEGREVSRGLFLCRFKTRYEKMAGIVIIRR